MKPISIQDDIVPIGEFKTHASRVMRQLRDAAVYFFEPNEHLLGIIRYGRQRRRPWSPVPRVDSGHDPRPERPMSLPCARTVRGSVREPDACPPDGRALHGSSTGSLPDP